MIGKCIYSLEAQKYFQNNTVIPTDHIKYVPKPYFLLKINCDHNIS